jgi:hypothetical protein
MQMLEDAVSSPARAGDVSTTYSAIELSSDDDVFPLFCVFCDKQLAIGTVCNNSK